MPTIDDLKDTFDRLTDDEKIAFVKSVVPFLCKTFRRNPNKMVEEMKPLCREMVKEGKVDIFEMLRTMRVDTKISPLRFSCLLRER